MYKLIISFLFILFSFSVQAQETELRKPIDLFIGGGIRSYVSMTQGQRSTSKMISSDYSILLGKRMNEHWNLGIQMDFSSNRIIIKPSRFDTPRRIDLEYRLFGRYQYPFMHDFGFFLEPSISYSKPIVFNSEIALGVTYQWSDRFRFVLELLSINYFYNQEVENNNTYHQTSLISDPNSIKIKGEFFLFNKKNAANIRTVNYIKYLLVGGKINYYSRYINRNGQSINIESYVGADFLKHWLGGVIFEKREYTNINEAIPATVHFYKTGFGVFFRLQKKFDTHDIFLQSTIIRGKYYNSINSAISKGNYTKISLSPQISYRLFKSLNLTISPGVLAYEKMNAEDRNDRSEIKVKFGLRFFQIGLELKFKQIQSFQN